MCFLVFIDAVSHIGSLCWKIQIYLFIHPFIYSLIKMAGMLTATFTHPFEILLPVSEITNYISFIINFCIWRTGYLPVSCITHPHTYTWRWRYILQCTDLFHLIHFWGSSWNFTFISFFMYIPCILLLIIYFVPTILKYSTYAPTCFSTLFYVIVIVI